jgi:uncharacterized protein involved in response to NO
MNLFAMGFRPFFLGAAVFAIVTMVQWAGVYTSGFSIDLVGVTLYQWHAHEMIYGYCMAVIAGFFLTATRNWTEIQTARGTLLLLLFTLWALARVSSLFGTAYWPMAALFDSLFSIFLLYCIVAPVAKSGQWNRMALVSKLLLLCLGNGLFYLGLGGVVAQGVQWSLYGGLFLILALIVTLSRKLVPFFIERAFDNNVTIKNYLWLDISSLLLFLLLFVLEVFSSDKFIASAAAAALFIVYSVRMKLWYVHGIWQKPLLWSLFVALLFINCGFLLMAIRMVAPVSPFIIVHTFSFGGIGLITMAMMTRVSLGHTGRDIHSPPTATSWMFGIFVVGAAIRVVMPVISPQYYVFWIAVSQIFWVLAFGIFVWNFTRVLTGSRIDGKPG